MNQEGEGKPYITFLHRRTIESYIFVSQFEPFVIFQCAVFLIFLSIRSLIIYCSEFCSLCNDVFIM